MIEFIKMKLRKKTPHIFFGWWIVIASFLVASYMGGAVYYGFTAFFEPVASEMGWSHTQISFAASLRGLEAGLLVPFTGILADRLGPRRLVFGGVLLTAAGLLFSSTVRTLVMFYIAFGVVALGLSGCAVTVPMTAIANWFRKRIGLASGIATCGFGFSGLLVPLLTALITTFEWRTTLVMVAVGMIIIILPLSLLFRHKPEQYGLLPDGQTPESVEDQRPLQPLRSGRLEGVSASQACKTGVFWRLSLAYVYHMLTTSAIVTHVMPYLSSIDMPRSESSFVAASIPTVSILGRLGFGWLGDKYGRKSAGTCGFAMMGAGMAFFGFANAGKWLLLPFLPLFCIGYGASNVLRPSLVREHFGRARFGAIYGLMEGIGATGGIAGPLLAGWAYDSWGNYQMIWLAFSSLSVVAVVSVLTLGEVKNVSPKGNHRC